MNLRLYFDANLQLKKLCKKACKPRFNAYNMHSLNGNSQNKNVKIVFYCLKCFGSLAQLVEQWTFNPLVPRSSRGRSTISKALIELIRAFFISLVFSAIIQASGLDQTNKNYLRYFKSSLIVSNSWLNVYPRKKPNVEWFGF